MAVRLQAAQNAAYQEEISRQNAEFSLEAAEQEEIEARLAPLIAKEKQLARQTRSWKGTYLLLLTGAALVDGLSIIFLLLGTIISPFILISGTITTAYSVFRFWTLYILNKGGPKTEEWQRNLRTVGSWIVKLIPVIGAVPLQSTTMMTEYYIKKASSAKLENELRSVREQIRQLSSF